MLYFMVNGEVKVVYKEQLLIKSSKVLKYVDYLLNVENEATRNWSRVILDVIRVRVQNKKDKYDGNYVPLYLTCKDKEAEMQRNSVFLRHS